MARRSKAVSRRTKLRKRKSNRSAKRRVANKSKRISKRRRSAISDARLERALRVLGETGDVGIAARSIRVPTDRFKRAAKRKNAIRWQNRNWIVARRLPRKMPIYTAGRQVAITVNSKSASLIARYMSAVGQFLQTNDPKYLAEFKDRSVKDARGRVHMFETDPNTLYRLSSAGGEPFEEMYRIVI